MTSDLTLRPLRDQELDEGYAIICAAYEWLRSRKIRQWTIPLARSEYRRWHANGGNYGLFVGDALAVVLSLLEGGLEDWPDVEDCVPVLWLYSLATHERFKGRDLGKEAVRRALEVPRELGFAVYLACVQGSGFLPAYYESLRFEVVGRETRTYGEHGEFDMVLMRWERQA